MMEEDSSLLRATESSVTYEKRRAGKKSPSFKFRSAELSYYFNVLQKELISSSSNPAI